MRPLLILSTDELQRFLQSDFRWTDNRGNRSSLFLIVLLEALTIVLAGVLVNSFRILVLGKLEQKISDKLAQRWGWHV